jgi:2-keto-4-pentenoate hydratase
MAYGSGAWRAREAHGYCLSDEHASKPPVHAVCSLMGGVDSRIVDASSALWRARLERAPIEVLTARWPDLDETAAYAIARATQALLGQQRVGYKLGYTSAAMRAQMGVEHPNYGLLTEPGRVPDEGEIRLDSLIHPLVEPEIAFVMARDVTDAPQDADVLLDAVASVHPALEIVDTRYTAYRFKACDNIADNSSAACFVLGAPRALRELPDLASVAVSLAADDIVLDHGCGADALGNPLHALAWLARRLLGEGAMLRAGDVVLTGGLTRAHAARAGVQFAGRFSGLGEVRVRFV